MKKRWLLIIGVILVGILMVSPILAYSETEAEKMPEEVERPEWNIGDYWEHEVTYVMKSGKERKGFISSQKVLKKEIFEEIECYVLAESTGSSARSYYTLDLNGKGFVNKVGSKVLNESKVTPDTKEYDWPLKVGKKWEQSYTEVIESRGKRGRGKLEKREITENAIIEVTKVETVEVPAGKFLALKIVKKVDDTVVEERWYSSKVRWFIKKVVYFKSDDPKAPKMGVWELTKYKVKNNK